LEVHAEQLLADPLQFEHLELHGILEVPFQKNPILTVHCPADKVILGLQEVH